MPTSWSRANDTTEEVIRLAGEITDTVCNEIGPVAMCKDPLSFAQKVSTRVAAIAKAEETEALTAAIDALEGITVVKYDPNGTTTEFTPCKLDIKA